MRACTGPAARSNGDPNAMNAIAKDRARSQRKIEGNM
jgi:hypothetical protein